MPRLIIVVGSAEVWLAFSTIGCSPPTASRVWVGTVPSEFAGQPISTRPDSVRSTPSASGRNEPVVVIMIGRSAGFWPSVAEGITGSMPRPEIARSSGCDDEISAPFWSITREVMARTPPAE